MAILTAEEALPWLRSEYQEGRLIPFIGAGFSKPLGLPLWRELLGWMAVRIGFEPDLFQVHGSEPQLAEYFQLQAPENLQSLVEEMKVQFDSAEVQTRRRASLTHQALARCTWRTIYTTNYDSHVEGALVDAGRPCVALASLEDFQAPRAPGTCEVIKFHGTLARPESIVLSESSYYDRLRLEGAADQRLRADLLSNSFLFIGYGFGDTNIRYIWYRMNQLRQRATTTTPPAPVRRCYFASFGKSPVQSQLLAGWNIDVIALDPTGRSESIARLLDGLG